jgi:FxsC-like protein
VSDLWFFLSYARRDDKGTEYVKQFHADLAREVARIAGAESSLDPEQVGFIDVKGNQPGGNWDSGVGEALQAAKVMVCVYSRGYFNSSYCGQEFEAFRRRLEAAGAGAGELPPLIVPVLWSAKEELPSPLPDAVRKIQYTYADFGNEYAEKGLYRLHALKDPAYTRFVLDFARLVVDLGRQHDVPGLPRTPSLQEIPNAFRRVDGMAGEEGRAAPAFGPKVAVFVFAAANQSDLQEWRETLHFYGADGGWDWRPFFPEVEDEVGLVCQEVATGERLRFQELPVGDSLREQIRQAEESNTVVVIVVDPWTLRVQRYKDPLSEYDKQSFWNCGVVISWNDGDAETQARRPELQRELESILFRNLSTNRVIRPVKSVGELRSALSEAINEVRAQIVKRADLAGGPIGPARPIPQLTGPSGNGP